MMVRDRYRNITAPLRRANPEKALIHTIRAGYGQEVEKRKPTVEQEAPICIIRTGRRSTDVVS